MDKAGREKTIEESDLTETELKELNEAFKALGVKPKTKSAAELRQWMVSYAKWTTPEYRRSEETFKRESASSEPLGATSSPHVTKHITPLHAPKLPVFSGDKKGDTSYDLWRYEVKCLMKDDVSAATILQSIRRSLRSGASRVLMRLGTDASIEEILHKFDSVYGIVDDNENLLSQFYSASQKENEDVSEWSCRLEDLLDKVIQRGEITPTNTDQMLRNMFWNGLSEKLKDITGHIFKECGDFDQLRLAIRKVEQDKLRKKGIVKKATINQAMPSNTQIDELKAMIQSMSTKMNEMREEINEVRTRYQGERHNSDQGNYSRGKDKQQGKDITCFKCGQKGHVAVGCRVRLDHKKDLNSKGPTSRRGRQATRQNSVNQD